MQFCFCRHFYEPVQLILCMCGCEQQGVNANLALYEACSILEGRSPCGSVSADRYHGGKYSGR